MANDRRLPAAAALALDAIGDAVFVLDEQDIIVHVNEPAIRLTGMTRAHLVGTTVDRILEPAESGGTFAASLLAAPGGLSRPFSVPWATTFRSHGAPRRWSSRRA